MIKDRNYLLIEARTVKDVIRSDGCGDVFEGSPKEKIYIYYTTTKLCIGLCTKGVLLLMILNVLLPEEKEKVVNANGQQSWLVFQLHLRAQILNS